MIAAAPGKGNQNPNLSLFARQAAEVLEGKDARRMAIAPHRLNGIATHVHQALELE
jgi:hypothetical protein